MSPAHPSNPLVCTMDVFTPEEREQHVQSTSQLLRSLRGVEDVPGGYRFEFPNDPDLIRILAEFIQKERLCCPFLDFALKIPSGAGSVELLLTGPEGTPEFLRSEFEEAFA